MSGRKDDDTGRATWFPEGTTTGDDTEPTEPGPPSPLSVPEEDRYEVRAEIGEGGMGKVLAVHDGRLGREVAYKELSKNRFGTRGSERFAREVWVTAQLEHPGIVPVYDAGQRPDGTSYYTMRYVHGRSLKVAMKEAGNLPERLALLGHFEDVCQAMAYAHSRGVIHRDLKPANVMLGAFGETQILDWGLARPVGDDDVFDDAPIQQFPGSGDHTLVGTVMGTPAYMSPEQAHGQPVDERSDVWSLGVMLYEILSGQRPFKGTDATDVLLAVRVGEFEAVHRVCPDAPAELAAVVARALAAEPDERYPTAKELRSDLSNYLTGRQVAAYAYSPGEILARLVRPYRAPLAVATVLLVALAVLGVDSYNRVKAGRDRARTAERSARTAEQVAKHHLNEALVEKARAAALGGAFPEAEVVAAHALLAGENPEARGVLAALGWKAHPIAASALPLPEDCVGLAVSADGKRAACATGESVSMFAFGGTEPLWTVGVGGRTVRIGGTPDTIAVLDETRVTFIDGAGPTVGRTVEFDTEKNPFFFTFSRGGRYLATRAGHSVQYIDTTATDAGLTDAIVCRGGMVNDVTFSDDDRWVGASCIGRTLWVASTSDFEFARIGTYDEEITALAFSPDGTHLSAGGIHGSVVVVDLADGEVHAYPGHENGIRQTAWSADGRLLAVSADDWQVMLWDVDSGRMLARLPTLQHGAMSMGFAGNNTLNTAGNYLRSWTLPKDWSPVVFAGESGLSGVDLSPDGKWIASAHGGGNLRIFNRHTGELAAIHSWEDTVVKRAAFSPNGRWVASSTATGRQIKIFAADKWDEVASIDGDSGFSRVGWTPDSSYVFGIDYSNHLHAYSVADWSEVLVDDHTDWHDIYLPAGGLLATADDATGHIFRLDGGNAFTVREIAQVSVDALSYAITPDAALVAASPRGRSVLLYHPPNTEPVGEIPVRDLVVHTLLSPDGRYLVTTHIDRVVRVWRVSSRTLRASLRGHRDRVVFATFDPSGETLITASWDGTARLWDMRVLDASPTDLVASRERDWGLDLATAIANPTR